MPRGSEALSGRGTRLVGPWGRTAFEGTLAPYLFVRYRPPAICRACWAETVAEKGLAYQETEWTREGRRTRGWRHGLGLQALLPKDCCFCSFAALPLKNKRVQKGEEGGGGGNAGRLTNMRKRAQIG